jgi:hypothetical protein
MFSLRRKSRKSEDVGPPAIRPTPSLPELSRNGPTMQWPAELVDISEVNESSAAKAELPADHGPIPFHKPFRSLSSSANGKPTTLQAPPSAFDAFKTRPSARKNPQRKTRVAPTFNLMVCFSLLFTASATQSAMAGCWTSRLREDIVATSVIGKRRFVTHSYRGSTRCHGALFTRRAKAHSVHSDCMCRNL